MRAGSAHHAEGATQAQGGCHPIGLCCVWAGPNWYALDRVVGPRPYDHLYYLYLSSLSANERVERDELGSSANWAGREAGEWRRRPPTVSATNHKSAPTMPLLARLRLLLLHHCGRLLLHLLQGPPPPPVCSTSASTQQHEVNISVQLFFN